MVAGKSRQLVMVVVRRLTYEYIKAFEERQRLSRSGSDVRQQVDQGQEEVRPSFRYEKEVFPNTVVSASLVVRGEGANLRVIMLSG